MDESPVRPDRQVGHPLAATTTTVGTDRLAGFAPDRRRRRRWIAGSLAALLVLAVVGAAVIRVPYLAVAPGTARAVEPSIVVPTDLGHRSQGTISFTTVSVREVTLIEALLGWLDPAIDVVPTEQQRGGLSAEENRQINQVRMDNSKDVAKQVAFEHLGYDVPVTGSGSLVASVEPGTPADRVLEPGDTIVAASGDPVAVNEDLTDAVDALEPGDELALTVERAGERTTEQVSVDLLEQPGQPGQPFIGVSIQTRDLSYEFPFEVEIDSGSVGGPSAGLAFTLGLLDRLTPGDLTGGVDVAVTGTMEPDGSVGPVGGVVQKAEAVRDAGIEVFLVPSAELELARAHAGNDLRVERADTLEQALEVLGTLGGNALALGSPGAEATEGT